MKNELNNKTNTAASIVFSVKKELFCLPVTHVKSILKLPRVFPVPQSPEYVMGVVNVDGNVIPLIDATLKLKMGNQAQVENPTMLVLERQVEGKTQQLGLHVDEVTDVIEFNDMHLLPLPTSKYEFDERLVDGVFQTLEDFVMKINVGNFFKHNLDDLNPALTLTTH
jgi:purine-binding chemotaxis protein CheW